MPMTANRKMRGWWRADLPPVTSTGERLVLRLHATTMHDFMFDASGLDVALACARAADSASYTARLRASCRIRRWRAFV